MGLYIKKKKFNKLLVGTILLIVALSGIFINKYTGNHNSTKKFDSEFGNVWVSDEKLEENNLRCLTFKQPPTQIMQSCEIIENPNYVVFPYVQMLLSTVFLRDNPERVLVMGLGGASIQKGLNELLPHSYIDTVEINSALPQIVEQYFSYKEDRRNKIYVTDAAEFAKNYKGAKYDIILLDAFDAEYIPPHLLTDEFMKNVKKMLTKHGVLGINTFASSKSYDLESALIKRNFGSYYNLMASGSRVMITNNSGVPDIAEIAQEAILWRFRFAELGISEVDILKLYQLVR